MIKRIPINWPVGENIPCKLHTVFYKNHSSIVIVHSTHWLGEERLFYETVFLPAPERLNYFCQVLGEGNCDMSNIYQIKKSILAQKGKSYYIKTILNAKNKNNTLYLNVGEFPYIAREPILKYRDNEDQYNYTNIKDICL